MILQFREPLVRRTSPTVSCFYASQTSCHESELIESIEEGFWVYCLGSKIARLPDLTTSVPQSPCIFSHVVVYAKHTQNTIPPPGTPP